MDLSRLRLRRSSVDAAADPVAASAAEPPATSRTEPPFDPTSWSGALIVMVALAALLWALVIVDRSGHHHFDQRFGLQPRRLDGLWGVVTQPLLHSGYGQLFSETVPFIGVGWVLLLSGLRLWAFVTAFVVVVGGFATWLVAPSGVLVGASALVFGWMGYLLARAYFSRRLKWILTAVAVLIFFGTLLGNLLPSLSSKVSWQSHLCGFLAGVLVGWLLHPRRAPRGTR